MFCWYRRFFWFVIFLIACGTAVVCYYLLEVEKELPNIDQLKTVELETPMEIYSNDGKLMAVFGEIKRKPVTIDQVPTKLIQAFVAIEDQRFYTHKGFDPIGIMRAAVEFAKTGKKKQGASTITQQVAKNFFLTPERTIKRKVIELLISIKIEQELTKDQIMELYLNKIALGHNTYGVVAAAEIYFGKDLQHLTIGEMAILAGLPKAPSSYNPISHPKNSEFRRNLVLQKMLEQNFITKKEFETAIAEPVETKYHPIEIEFQSDYVAEMTRQRIIDNFGEEVTRQGIKVFTTVNSQDQALADLAVFKGLTDYDRRHGFRGPVATLWNSTEKPWEEEKIYKYLEKQPNYSLLEPAVVLSVDTKEATVAIKGNKKGVIGWDGIKWAGKFLTDRRIGNSPKNAKEVLKPGYQIFVYTDEKDVLRLSQLPAAQAALISLDSHNGAIKAVVGGFSFKQSKFNRAEQAKRQAGSNIKPFVYSAALQNGYTLSTLVLDAPISSWETGKKSGWSPKNSPNVYDGPITVREALAKSKNVVAVRLLRGTGLMKVVEHLNNFGLTVSKIYQNDPLALGSLDVTPLQLVRGYAAISNGGFLINPYIVDRIEDAQGNVLFKANPIIACPMCKDHVLDGLAYSDGKGHRIAPQIISHANAFLISEAMHTAIYGGAERGLHGFNGTGWRTAKLMPNRKDFSGKTGTSNDSRDCWFSGLNSNYVTTVWTGFDNQQRNLGRESGATVAQPIWNYFMVPYMKDKPESPVLKPNNVFVHRVDRNTGLFVNQGAGNSRNEFFENDTDPSVKSTGTFNYFNYENASEGENKSTPDVSDIF
ncbi:MAG: penicillin-binding protein 1A [Succinivibrionaceae bacterium]|nr:penicillin-binding protein 1A [Succinivibrionaceae bacterium]